MQTTQPRVINYRAEGYRTIQWMTGKLEGKLAFDEMDSVTGELVDIHNVHQKEHQIKGQLVRLEDGVHLLLLMYNDKFKDFVDVKKEDHSIDAEGRYYGKAWYDLKDINTGTISLTDDYHKLTSHNGWGNCRLILSSFQ